MYMYTAVQCTVYIIMKKKKNEFKTVESSAWKALFELE